MPRRALIDHRPWLLASLIAGVSYFFVADDPIGGVWLMLWKGAGVAFLAIYAAFRGKGIDGLLIAAALMFGALGDIALEISFLFGGGLFAVGHLIAIALYLRNRRERTSPSQLTAALALLALTPVIAGLMTYPLENWMLAIAYSGLVGAMAAAAWTSGFPRYRVGAGAVAFVISDLLIFAREAAVLPDTVTSWLIWPLYYCGQFLIATGVVQTLRNRRIGEPHRG
ncbi:lysoplasmalogenase [Qipengyuania qiaonensis]|uniref:Lysoplasmalogenase n=1 Tax=Qipengyuania qiaonensis TaxID=2867240 RepID=A0ABS7J5F7_9SPHN|nr:lysoplasmalogenase [Qipengyuania qiaonensis]MBX7481230.1 lysoplasmalogenase [Qipengyuania qiaonensis]